MAAAVPVADVDAEVKLRFASAFVRSKNASAAALKVIPDNPGLALRLSYSLPNDPIVIAEIARLREEVGEDGLLPSKADIAREIYDRAKAAVVIEDYERLMKLYCSIMGHIEKPGTNVTVNATVAPVMVVRDHGSDDEWKERVAEQQKKLMIDASNESQEQQKRLTIDASN